MAASLLRLVRSSDDGVQTTGELLALDAAGRVLARWHSLERPWMDNRARQSCIPPGRYWVVHRSSSKFGRHLHVTDVEGRSWILVHPGNTWRDVVGCIMVGTGVGHVDRDGRLDVTGSRAACAALRALVPERGVWVEVFAPGEPLSSFRAQHAAPVAGPSRLALGARGDGVVEVQRALKAAGFFDAGLLDVFGTKTDAAVRAFQRDRGLDVDGVVGPDTLDALGL